MDVNKSTIAHLQVSRPENSRMLTLTGETARQMQSTSFTENLLLGGAASDSKRGRHRQPGDYSERGES